jgi:hypothetical protein
MSTSEQVIGTLVLPEDYIRHLNQVAAVTSDHLVLVKRKFVSRSGTELVRHPLDRCASVSYFDERPVATLVSGVLLLGLVGSIVALLIVSWRDLAPGTKLFPGVFALVAIWGARRLFGARRHRLVFTMKDGKRLRWASRPGDFDVHAPAVSQVLEFARARELLPRADLVRSR